MAGHFDSDCAWAGLLFMFAGVFLLSLISHRSSQVSAINQLDMENMGEVSQEKAAHGMLSLLS